MLVRGVGCMRIIDFHTHIYPPAVAAKATESICQFYELSGAGMEGTAEALIQRGKTAGISQFVVLPVAMKPDRVRHINAFIAEEVAAHKEFFGFGSLHAQMENACEEVSWIAESGLKGIKMHPDFQKFDIDDIRLYPAYDRMRSLGLPVLFHMGDTRYDYSHPLRLRRLMDQFPGLQVIAAHFGGYSMYETAYEYLKDTDCLLDISSSLMFMEEKTALQYIRRYGAERLVFGSDYPLWNPEQELERFLNLGLEPEEMEQIAWKTACRILKIDEDA